MNRLKAAGMTFKPHARAMVLLLIAVMIINSLAGCALIKRHMVLSEIERISKEKAAAVESSKELDPIREKVWMGALKDDPPLRMLALTEKATDAERSAITKWHSIFVSHKNQMLDLARKDFPLYVGALEESYSEDMGLIVQLYNQNIAYGEYNRKMKENYAKYLQKVSAIDLQQSMRPAAPKTSFSCYTIGNQTNCN